MAERSKAVHLSCILSGGVGSNPTSATFLYYYIIIYINNKACRHSIVVIASAL